MTVYVDNMRRPARVGRINARWSHLVADTPAELAEFAARLGLNPAWIQHPGTHREHYDLTDTRRADAIRLGAVEVTYPHGLAEIIGRKCQEDPLDCR